MDLVLSRGLCRVLAPLATVLLGVTACTGADDGTQPPSGDRPQLVVPGVANEVALQVPARANESWVHGTYTLCLDKPGAIRVEDVEYRKGNLTITGWALQLAPTPDADGVRMFTGEALGTLRSNEIEDVEVLERVCDGKGNSYELVLELRTGKESAEGDGILVHYVSDGEEGKIVLPERLVMCVEPEMPSCM